MFFEPDRIPKIRQMILARTVEQREKALNALIPFQKGDFKALYEVMEGRPVYSSAQPMILLKFPLTEASTVLMSPL